MRSSKITLTINEQKAIKALESWAKKCPKTLALFGWSGTLCVVKTNENGVDCVVAGSFDISCDGGDPTDNELIQVVEIDYE